MENINSIYHACSSTEIARNIVLCYQSEDYCITKSYVSLGDARLWTILAKLIDRVKKQNNALQGCVDALEQYEQAAVSVGDVGLFEKLGAAKKILAEEDWI